MNHYRPCIVSTTTNRDTNRIVVKTNRYTPNRNGYRESHDSVMLVVMINKGRVDVDSL